jgi:hypothetical protein
MVKNALATTLERKTSLEELLQPLKMLKVVTL